MPASQLWHAPPLMALAPTSLLPPPHVFQGKHVVDLWLLGW